MKKGTAVVMRETARIRRCSKDFPGWDSPDYRDYLLAPESGIAGIVTAVESHGNAPFTRYTVRFADGSIAGGCTMEDVKAV